MTLDDDARPAAGRPRFRSVMATILRTERHTAMILLGAAALGVIIANSPIGAWMLGVRSAHLPIAALDIRFTAGEWVTDLLLAVFFFIVAVELKAEMVDGELNSVRKALVPGIAAVFGVAGPALVFLLISGGGDVAHGWPVPTATDIAFAVGILAMFGRFLPNRMRVFLLALAVIDDLIGILIIAVLFARDLDFAALGAAVVVVAAFALLSRVSTHRRRVAASMVLLAVLAWYLVQQSGIHPTVAAVALGIVMAGGRGAVVADRLVPWSAGLILPLFAFTAALVAIPAPGDIGPLFLGLAVALPVGKAVGITIGGMIGARVARAHLTNPVLGWDLFALAVTGGLGFTVALLMGQLAFRGQQVYLDQSVLGVLVGSVISLIAGALLIAWRSRTHRRLGAVASPSV